MDLKTIGVVLGLTIPFVLLTVLAIVSASQKNFGSTGKKALWMLVAAIPFFGFIVYFLFGRRQALKEPE